MMHETWLRFKALLRRRQLDRDLRDELEFHLAMREQTSSEACARRRFGNVALLKESSREMWTFAWIEALWQDLRFSSRTLRKSPAFAIAAALTLAIGIGANTAIFSVVNTVFLRPLPYVHPERVVWATEYFPKFNRAQIFAPEYAAWRKENSAFEGLDAYGIAVGVNLSGENRVAERVQVGHVTSGFFTTLGVQPQVGRTFRPEEDQPDTDHVVVLSDGLWRNYFHADPQVLDKPVALNGAPFTVIGVMPPGFMDPGASHNAAWLPDAVDAKSSIPGRSMRYLGGVIGRLKPGVTAEQARANLEVIARRMDNQYPTPWSSYHAAASVQVISLQEQLTSGSRTAIYVLMGAVGFILLIVCANVANMFLARAMAREREIAIRAAIGASRSRLVRLLLMESLLFGVCGGLIGMLLAYWGVPGLGFLMQDAIPRYSPIDLRVLGFAAFCSILTGVIFGLAPALTLSKLDLNISLKGSGGHLGRHQHRFSLRGGLAVAQIALSLILLVGAGLLIRTFFLLMSVDPGFNPHNVLLAAVSLAPQQLYGSAQQGEYFHRALDAIQKIPGVEYAAVTDESPLVTFQSVASGLAAEGKPATDDTVVPTSASADYFNALQIPLLAGRFFDERDRNGAQRVAILNRTLARILFPNLDPLGRRIRFGDETAQWVTVVGIVADIRHRALDDKIWPELFEPYEQAPSAWMSFVIRTSTDPLGLIAAIRKTAAGIDRNQPLFDVESLEQRLSHSVAERRQRAVLLGSFAFVALIIAVVGVYGVMAYSVTRRTHEMGVRIALGAKTQDVLTMVLAEGLRIALIGVVIGLAGAVGLSRVVAGFLYGVTPTDAATFVSVCTVLVLAACIASYIPAWRATKVDPMIALRHE